MGSSARKKKEKKKDFQVSRLSRASREIEADHSLTTENKTESRKDEGKVGQFH